MVWGVTKKPATTGVRHCPLGGRVGRSPPARCTLGEETIKSGAGLPVGTCGSPHLWFVVFFLCSTSDNSSPVFQFGTTLSFHASHDYFPPPEMQKIFAPLGGWGSGLGGGGGGRWG